MKLQDGDTFLLIGDSITDCDRVRPIGEGRNDPLGRGYVNFVNAMLGAAYPDRLIRVTNMGISGNTVRDLKARWESDVIALKPDWVSCLIGINDVWRQFDSPLARVPHVLPEEFERTYVELVEKTRPQVKGMVLMAPFYLEPNRHDAMRARMDEYGRIVAGIAERFALPFVDTQAAFDAHLARVHSGYLAWDRVHPNQVGHMVIARTLLNAIDFEWQPIAG